MSWALLLGRSFAVDALTCKACGGRRELIAVIEHKPTVGKILAHLGMDTELPAFALPRGPPLFAEFEAPVKDAPAWGALDMERRVVLDPEFVEPADS